MDGVRLTSPFLDLAIVMLESIPPGFRVRAGFDTVRGAAETGRAWGVPAAGESAVLFLSANTACQLVGISVGIDSRRRQKLSQLQLVMVLSDCRPGAPC
jgi:hypothetical protein